MSYSNGIGDWKQVLNPITPTSASETQQTSDRAKAAAVKPAIRTETDETKLSPTGELISQALGSSDVRSAKVEALQKAIAAGTYQVSSSDVAGKLIDSLLK
jgi:negative regulator of flagellin synthesis FlgM